MRGDSLRDFYAKTFVVLGLGVIAAAGAIVDYWPSNAEWPVVARVRLPVPDIRIVTADLDQQIPAPVIRQAAPRALPVAAVAELAPAALAFVHLEHVELAAPPPPPPPDFVVALAPVAPLPAPAVLALGAPPPIEPVAAGPSGLSERVSDAVKWTRDSIREARATVRGALTGMFGTLRKVSPFFSTTAAY